MPDPMWVTAWRFAEIQWFESPLPDPGNINAEEVRDWYATQAPPTNPDFKNIIIEIESRLKISGGHTLWQMNVISGIDPRPENLVRMIAVMATRRCVKWTDEDMATTYAQAVAECAILNAIKPKL